MRSVSPAKGVKPKAKVNEILWREKFNENNTVSWPFERINWQTFSQTDQKMDY